MGFKTLVFVALIAFLSVQISAKTIPEVPKEPKDITNVVVAIVQSVLEAFNKSVKESLDAALDVILAVSSNADSIKDAIVNEASKMVHATVDKLVEKLDDLKANTSAVAVDVIECFEGEQEAIEKSLSKAIDSSATCVEIDGMVFLNATINLVSDLETYNAQLKKLENGLSDCNADNLVECVGDLLQKAADIASKIPEVIKPDVDAAVEALKAMVADVQRCIQVGLDQVNSDAINIVNDAATCIENKIKG